MSSNNKHDSDNNDSSTSLTAAGSSTTTPVVESPVASIKLTPDQILHIFASLLVHDLFVFFLATTDSLQWVFFCLLQALVPPVYASVYFFFRHTTSTITKLLCRIYFSSTAICGIVYVVIGSLWIYDERKTFVISLATIGLISSLNHWYRLEVNCFRTKTNNNETLERDLEEQDLELS